MSKYSSLRQAPARRGLQGLDEGHDPSLRRSLALDVQGLQPDDSGGFGEGLPKLHHVIVVEHHAAEVQVLEAGCESSRGARCLAGSGRRQSRPPPQPLALFIERVSCWVDEADEVYRPSSLHHEADSRAPLPPDPVVTLCQMSIPEPHEVMLSPQPLPRLWSEVLMSSRKAKGLYTYMIATFVYDIYICIEPLGEAAVGGGEERDEGVHVLRGGELTLDFISSALDMGLDQ